MWTSEGEFDTGKFAREVSDNIELAMELSVSKKSRNFSWPQIILAIISTNSNSKRLEGLEADKCKIMDDVNKIIGRNYKSGVNERSCIETLGYLIIEGSSSSGLNYFDKSLWDETAIKIFKEIDEVCSNLKPLFENTHLNNSMDIDFSIYSYIVFKNMDIIPESDRKLMDDLLDIASIVISLGNYIKASFTKEESVFKQSGELRIEKFSEMSAQVVQNTINIAGELGYENVIPLHFLLEFSEDKESFSGRVLIKSLPVDESLKSIHIKLERMLSKGPGYRNTKLTLNRKCFSDKAILILESSLKKAAQEAVDYIKDKHLLSSLLEFGGDIFENVLKQSLKIDINRLLITANSSEISEKAEIFLPLDIGTGFLIDENLKGARQIIGRDKVISEIGRIFFRKQKKNIVLSGDKGIGKTSVMYALLNKIQKGGLKFLKGIPIIYFNINDIPNSELSSKVIRILNYMDENYKRIYFVDGFSKLYFSNPDMVKTCLKKNKYNFVGIVNSEEFSDLNREIANINDSFEFLQISEPSEADVKKILSEICIELKEEYGITIESELIDKIYKLCEDFLLSERFPSKAINIMRLACSDLAYKNSNLEAKDNILTLKKEDIGNQISQITELPMDLILGTGEGKDFVQLLNKAVMGQERAVDKVAERLNLIQSGMVDKNKPPAVFLFIGLSGTGKTELATEIAKVYSSSRKLITYAMENFKDRHNVSGIIGTSAGYIGYEEGGRLINDLNKDPYSVVLFDEIEKAHPDIWDPFLELFDKGCIRDLRGNLAYGNKAFFILTSNIGYEKISVMINQNKSIEEIEKVIQNELYAAEHAETKQKCFRPEFIGRISRLGGIVVFSPLSYNALRDITKKVVCNMCKEWTESRESNLIVDDNVIDFIASKAYEENKEGLSSMEYSTRLNNATVAYKGGRIVFSLIDVHIKGALVKSMKEFYGQKEIRVILEDNNITLLYDRKNNNYNDLIEERKDFLVKEVKDLFFKIGLADKLNELQNIQLNEIEKIRDSLKDIMLYIKK